jgi:hypothetical protein
VPFTYCNLLYSYFRDIYLPSLQFQNYFMKLFHYRNIILNIPVNSLGNVNSLCNGSQACQYLPFINLLKQ